MEKERGGFFLWTPIALGLRIVSCFALPFELTLIPSGCFALALFFMAIALKADQRGVNAKQDRPLRPWNARYQKLMIEKNT
jgi:hypothetical protein